MKLIHITFSLLFCLSLVFGSELKNWTIVNSKTTKDLYDIIYKDGEYIVVGSKGYVLKSTDGTNWNIVFSKGAGLVGVTYGKGKYIGVGENGTIKVSVDGENWSTINTGLNIDVTLTDVIFNGFRFVAIGEEGTILYSDDGTIWKTVEKITDNTLFNVKYIIDAFYATGTNATLLKSSDGINWEKVNVELENPRHFGAIAYGNGKWVIVASAGKVLVSNDMVNWKEKSVVPIKIGKNRILVDVIYSSGYFVGVGQYGIILISKDGENWDTVKLDKDRFLTRVINAQNRFIAVGLRGTIAISDPVNIPTRDDPDVVINQSVLDYSSVLLNESKTIGLVIKNNGNSNLEILEINIKGEDKQQFKVDNINACKLISPKNTCILNITFQPKSEGKKIAVLEILTNDPDEIVKSVVLTGIGVNSFEPDIEINTNSIDFGRVHQNLSKSEILIINNKGSENLIINNIQLNGEGFKYLGGCDVIEPENSCIISVRFEPKSSGEYNGSIIIRSNDPDTPEINIVLKGSGVSPDEVPYLSDSYLNFGKVPINSYKERTIYVINKGSRSFSNIRLSLNDPDGAFSYFDSCEGNNLSRGEECIINVRFSPANEGKYIGELKVTYDSGSFLFGGGEKSVFIDLEGVGYKVKDEYTLLNTKFIVQNGTFIDPPEQIKGVDIDKNYLIFNNISYKYSIGILGNYQDVNITVELPFEFNPQTMEVFDCTNECRKITAYVSVDPQKKNIIYLNIRDGSELDNDNLVNKIIETSIIIAQEKPPEEVKSSSSGGGGCQFGSGSFYTYILLVLLILLRKTRSGRSW